MHAGPLHPTLKLLIGVLKNIRDPFCLTDAENHPVHLNSAFLTLSGYETLPEFNEANGLQHVLQLTNKPCWHTLKEGSIWQHEACLVSKGGDRIPVQLRIIPLIDENEHFVGAQYIFAAAPRYRDETELLTLLKSFVEHANDAVMITEAVPIDEPGPRITYVNPAFTRITDYTAQEVIGQSPRLLQGPGTDRTQLNKIRAALIAQQPLKVELINYKKNGEEFWVDFSLVPVSTKAGSITHYVSVQRETTEKKKAQERLLKSQQQLKQALQLNKQIFKHSLDVICIIDSKGKFVQLSPASESTWGYTPEEMLGRPFLDFVHPHDLEKSYNITLDVRQRGHIYDFENRYMHKNGSVVPMMWTGSWSEEDQLLYATARNISERKEVENKLLQSEHLYRTVVENFPNGTISIIDSTYTITFIAGLWLSQLNNKVEQFIGKSIYDLYDVEKATKVVNALAPTFKGQSVTFEEVFNDRYFLCRTVPMFENKLVGSFLLFTQDITDKKEAEETLRIHAEQLEKINSELDQFVYKTSHDLRAPLVSLLGLINLTQSTNCPAEQKEYFQLMTKSVKKLDSFIHDIISFSKSTRSKLTPLEVDFNTIVEESIENLVYMEEAKSITIQKSIIPVEGFYSDQKRIEIILNNIISNAIRYRDRRKEQSFIKIAVAPAEDKSVMLSIEDNGLGIAKEHQSKIYEMFYRATDTNVGSGLGLYIVKENINRLGGTIAVESELGKGTKFTLHLPSLI